MDFNGIGKVKCTLVQLKVKYDKADEMAKSGIQEIIDMYQAQQKALVQDIETGSNRKEIMEIQHHQPHPIIP